MNCFFEGIGCLAGVCMAVSFGPQAWQTFKTKNVKGLSAVTYSIYNLGVFCWVVYGFYLQSLQMIIFNALCLCFSLPILIMILKYEKNKT